MKRLTDILFVVVCLVICIIPFGCMTFAKTDSTTENKRLKEFPPLYDDGINISYLEELGGYFEDHFAFRNAFVNTDSEIQSRLFGVSNMDTVIKGTDGWLYYTDTLDDYLGRNTLSDRGIFNIYNNLFIMEKYVENRGAKFALTIAPNKNSLYDDNMPYYYSFKASDNKNINKLEPYFNKEEINYVDLFNLFENQSETLYLKRDSHWNNKGAMLVYNQLMQSLDLPYDDYSATKTVRKKTEIGDLNTMLYPVTAEPEWNYYYDKKQGYTYINKVNSVEDPWIETENPDATGDLLMFRDSFGNTLIPFFADEFNKCYFSKGTPYPIEDYMNIYNPDCVIVEKVERNIDEFAFSPPLITGIPWGIYEEIENAETDTTLSVDKTEISDSYLAVSGVIDKKYIETETEIFVEIENDNISTTYKAFNISDENGDNGFLLYLPKSDFLSNGTVHLNVVINNKGKYIKVKSGKFNIAEVIQ